MVIDDYTDKELDIIWSNRKYSKKNLTNQPTLDDFKEIEPKLITFKYYTRFKGKFSLGETAPLSTTKTAQISADWLKEQTPLVMNQYGVPKETALSALLIDYLKPLTNTIQRDYNIHIGTTPSKKELSEYIGLGASPYKKAYDIEIQKILNSL